MSDYTDLLERARERFPAPELEIERVLAGHDRRVRNQRIAAGAVALVLAIVVVGSALAVIRSSDDRQPGSSGVVVPVDPGINQACGPSDACWDADVFTMNVDGTQVTRLGYDEERDFGYSWSPDGGRIAFYRGTDAPGSGRFDASWNVFTMATDGSDVRRLSNDDGMAGFPVYSPDGSRIAYTSERDGIANIWVMDADGSNRVPLTASEGETLDDYHPAWSPDGERIAFVRGVTPPGEDGRLWLIDADGSNARVLPDAPLVTFPVWSPDGDRIAFTTGDWPDAVRTQILDLKTGAVTDVIAAIQPRWSPDGTRLLVSLIDGGFGILDVDAPDRVEMLRSTGWATAWSPDGERILFNDAGLTASTG
jgi:TolB protein